MRATLLHVAAFACFFVGLFFVSQAYTMAFHGVYLDCFGGGCAPRTFGEPTLPSQLATERQINPFLRSREAAVLQAVRAHAGLSPHSGEAEVFAALRQWKNDFR